MSDAKRCDICKTFYTIDDFDLYDCMHITVKKAHCPAVQEIDLCPGCGKKFKSMVERSKVI